MFLKLMILHVGCVEVLRPALHGQLFKGRRTSCKLLQCSNIANSFNLSQNIPNGNYEKCRHVFWLVKKLQTPGGGYSTVYSMGFLFKVSVTPECNPM